MQKIIFTICFLLSFQLNWGQTPKVVPIANVDFSQNESTVFELNGESQYKTIICQRKNQLTVAQLRSIIETGLNKIQVNWLRINTIHDNGEIVFEIDPNTTNTTRECTFISTFNRSRIQIVQKPRASIAEFNVTGGGSVTLNGRTTSITLSGSEIGVTYSLYRNGTKTESKSGTGNPILFNGIFHNGIYTIKGEKNGAERIMPGNANFTEYSVLHNVSFKSTIVYTNVNTDGGVYTINFALTGNGSLGEYRRELLEIIDLCNNGNIPTWNKEHRIILLKSTMEECILGIYISPKISTTTITSQLDFIQGRQIKLIQATGGNVIRFNVLGNGNIIPGDKFYVELDGAQKMIYGLYFNGVKIKEQMGSMDRVKFNDLVQLGTYTIKAETEGQSIAMNGSVIARDIRQNPSYLIEETYTGINQKVEDITFYDGIGRIIQTNHRAASPREKILSLSWYIIMKDR